MFQFKRPRNELEPGRVSGGQVAPAIPDKLFTVCPVCKNSFTEEELALAGSVCPRCGHHYYLKARKRIELLCDSESFVEMDCGAESVNLLDFPEYDEKLQKAKRTSAEKEAVITGFCTIRGQHAAVFAMEGAFMMGSMGTVVGEKITKLFEYATDHRLPVIGFTVSGGARMQEGILSLMQMAKTSGAVARHNCAGLLYITVLTNPTTGGVTASFAMDGDIILSEPGALICFAGPRVIAKTTNQKLPPGFQTAEFLLEKGFVDRIVARKDLPDLLTKLLELHRGTEEVLR